MFREIKPEIRILGWDDSAFTPKDKNTLLIGVVCRGGSQIDGIITARIRIDGTDATRQIIDATSKSPHYKQIRVLMLDGLTFGGFNIADMQKIHKSLKMPVIVVIRSKPDSENIRKSLGIFKDHEKRWKNIEKAGIIRTFRIRKFANAKRNMVYCQYVGIDERLVEKILNLTSIHSLTPEPLRIAHMIGHGLKGRKIL